LTALADLGVIDPFAELEELIPVEFNDHMYQTIINYLAREKKKLVAVKRAAMDRRDLIYYKMLENLGGEDNYLKFKDEHFNDKIEELLTNEYSSEIAPMVDNRLLRKKNLVYMPPNSRFGRAHFYAPVKRLGELSIDTYLFNAVFIWLTTLVLYMALVFDVLRKIVNWAERVKLRKKTRSSGNLRIKY
jgi:hypothetical protein